MNSFDTMNDIFKLPIFYDSKKISLKSHIIDDLELVSINKTNNDINIQPLYSHTLNNTSDDTFSYMLNKQISNYYTTNVDFLKDYQTLLKTYQKLDKKYVDYSDKYNYIMNAWNEVKGETSFKEKYYYVDWKHFEYLNKSEHFLQLMSWYNLASPIFSLITPIIILIIPFFVIRLKGLQLNITEYIQILKTIASQHAIGKLFTKFTEVSSQEKMYLLISAAFYMFSIYQNVLTCIRFNQNMVRIHNYLKEIQAYLDYTIRTMNNYILYSKDLISHQPFLSVLKEKTQILREFKNKIDIISEYKMSIKKMTEIGYVLKQFYEFYEDDIYHEAFMYSFGFNGYIDSLEGLIQNIQSNYIHFTDFTERKGKNKFINNYYGVLKQQNPIKNTINLDKNMIITGPNASGKTTIIKSVLINILLSQQFGCGFYDSAQLCPYDFLHCYLNIPDTSGRDSLFQAEARRCKEMIDSIDGNPNKNHFCAFDELYSGTNPEEAVSSASAFMKYIIKNKNVSCILTTHFIKVCKKLAKYKNILNYHLMTTKENEKLVYSYILKKGISSIKGGVHVLCDMNYPKEIIDDTLRENK
jgi:hypothetical protein